MSAVTSLPSMSPVSAWNGTQGRGPDQSWSDHAVTLLLNGKCTHTRTLHLNQTPPQQQDPQHDTRAQPRLQRIPMLGGGLACAALPSAAFPSFSLHGRPPCTGQGNWVNRSHVNELFEPHFCMRSPIQKWIFFKHLHKMLGEKR